MGEQKTTINPITGSSFGISQADGVNKAMTNQNPKVKIILFVTHSNGKELDPGVGVHARRFIGQGASVHTAIKDAVKNISAYWPFRKNSKTVLTFTLERTK